jgi:hypothetical protein
MAAQPDLFADMRSLVDSAQAELTADILVYYGEIGRLFDDATIYLCQQRTRRPRVLFFLTTAGGSADQAYRIARCLRRSYGSITMYIDGPCKSAGTLLTLCADELVISDTGELGPLDVQLSKPDEIGEQSSGLTPIQAINTLQVQAHAMLEDYMIKLRARSGLQITTRYAIEIASNMAIGLFTPIYAQIDPMRLGEVDRATRIAVEYGKRISTRNVKPDAIARLVTDYPSHGFVIDRDEAAELFQTVRPPSPLEARVAEQVRQALVVFHEGYRVAYLDELIPAAPASEQQEAYDGRVHDGPGGAHSTKERTGDSAPGGADGTPRPEPEYLP